MSSPPPPSKVPPACLIAYGSGGAANNILGNAIPSFAFYVLNLGLGISPTVVGILLALPRLYDAVTDPLMGHFSDRFDSRWGRRRPFVLWGAFGAAAAFVLLWQIPREWAPDGYFWAFLVLSIVFYTATTVFSVPWMALGYDLTSDMRERTRVMAGVQIAASLTGIGMVWLLPVTQWDIFEDTIQGMRWVSLPIALFVALCGVAVFVFCRERHAHSGATYPGSSEAVLPAVAKPIPAAPAPGLKGSLMAALHLRPFLLLCGIVVAMILGIFAVNSMTPFIIIFFLKGGDLAQGSTLIALNGTVWTVTGLLMVPVVAWAANRFGKKRTLFVSLLLALLGNSLKWWLYSPSHPWAVAIPQFFVATAFASLWTILNSMMADVCDYGELQYGARIEGMLAGIYGWLMKLGVALAFFFGGLLIDLTGFRESAGAAQAEGVVTSMRLVEIGLPAVAYIFALALLAFYPLNESRMRDIQARLATKSNCESTTD